ncbi:glycosyltransferase [Leptothoe spongobia]|uniref:Glycosyltransferase n=1 Tax=Leptothoe spongobia TAU-MAC 1115 TaxID=1967444 RepID=A0A947DCF8_9CYAN|nr:glycosyltransferase [Leptothoe spongobia]MBT9314585.1 glycosyltransferase [Leptothoe spongobia TAU-MAC 1115]
MKVLHLSTGDLGGGAFRGTYWLHQGLLRKGIDSKILVSNKLSDDSTIIKNSQNTFLSKLDQVRSSFDELSLAFYQNRLRERFSPAYTSSFKLKETISKIQPDIVHLHWINGGFLNPEMIGGLNIPTVWTLRDMWPFSGGCHYAGECNKYLESCGKCPILRSKSENDISRNLWSRKKKAWQNSNIRVVAISNWLADCARASSLFRNQQIVVIHNAVDEKKFRPMSRDFSREALALPPNKKIIAFGAINPLRNKKKGFQYLAKALKRLSNENFKDSLEVLIFGSSKPEQEVDIGFKINYLGRLHDDVTLSLVYSAADVMVVPSIQEGFGKTAIEAMACATPVISFDSTGLKDIVEHKLTGYRAECFSVDDLAYGISWILHDEQHLIALSRQARESVEKKFTITKQVDKYHQLYKELIS